MLACFTKAKVLNGMDYISHLISLEDQIASSSLVCTGEGSLDNQTLEGKVVSKIYQLCMKHNKPLFIICGVNKLSDHEMQGLFEKASSKVEVYDLVSNFGMEASLERSEECLKELMLTKVCQNISKIVVNS